MQVAVAVVVVVLTGRTRNLRQVRDRCEWNSCLIQGGGTTPGRMWVSIHTTTVARVGLTRLVHNVGCVSTRGGGVIHRSRQELDNGIDE